MNEKRNNHYIRAETVPAPCLHFVRFGNPHDQRFQNVVRAPLPVPEGM